MNTTDVVVETPKNSRFKYKYEHDLKGFKMAKVLPAGLVFPYDFGFIPKTKGEDGDELDILVISEHALFPGCIVECKIIGSIKANQTEHGETKRNDRIIGVPVFSDLHQNIESLEDISKDKMKGIQDFFIHYNELANKKFEVVDILDSEQTWKFIKEQQQ